MRRAIATLALLYALDGAAAAQEARAKLFVREEQGLVRAAIEIEIAASWHLYHGPTRNDLGPPDAIGKPTTVALSGGGVDWGPVRFPQPERAEQEFGDEKTWIYQHEGTIVLRADGHAAPGADLSELEARIDGLTCSSIDGQCIPYRETLRPAGRGRDELFAASAAPAGPPATGADALSSSPPLAAERDSADDPKVQGELWARCAGDELRVALRLSIAEGWYVYHGPTKRDVGTEFGLPTVIEPKVGLTGAVWGPVVYPHPKRVEEDLGFGEPETVNKHEGAPLFYARAENPAGSFDVNCAFSATAGVRGQVCGFGICLPFNLELKSAGAGPDEIFAAFPAQVAAVAGAPSALAGPAGPAVASDNGVGRGLWLFLLAAVGWGLFTLLMPCTYPMIPITISFFTKQASSRGGRVLPLALTYGAGIVAIFVLIGVVIGPVIIRFATHPVTNLAIGLLFLLFALVLFGVMELRPPAFLMSAAGKASRRGGYAGVFLMGATLVVTSFTCTAPFVGSLLSLGATQAGGAGVGRIALGMAVFGVTMAVPFVLLSLVPGKLQAMPRSGEWMHVLKVFLGFVEIAAALKFFSNSDLVWGWGVLSRELFLFLWFGLFLAAGLFLFGLIRLQGETETAIGPKRMTCALATLLLAVYCLYGGLGNEMDRVMTAIIPPYSNASGGGADEPEVGHTIVVDDYSLARQTALRQGKGLLVNFTGHTCVNCRMMERAVFTKPTVARELRNYVEARLHTDGTTNLEDILARQRTLTQSVANPYYVILNPHTEEVLARQEGAVFDPERFARFLREHAGRARDFQTATAR